MNFKIIHTAIVKGHTVHLSNAGGVHFCRDLFDLLREDLQGLHFTAKTIKEFDNVCSILAL